LGFGGDRGGGGAAEVGGGEGREINFARGPLRLEMGGTPPSSGRPRCGQHRRSPSLLSTRGRTRPRARNGTAGARAFLLPVVAHPAHRGGEGGGGGERGRVAGRPTAAPLTVGPIGQLPGDAPPLPVEHSLDPHPPGEHGRPHRAPPVAVRIGAERGVSEAEELVSGEGFDVAAGEHGSPIGPRGGGLKADRVPGSRRSRGFPALHRGPQLFSPFFMSQPCRL